jgi:outer membrane PBP1 activator LpoA protein
MGRTTTSVKISRVKLIEILEEKVSERKKTEDKRFNEQLADKIKRAKESVKSAEKHLSDLEKIKTIDDAKDEYWARGIGVSEDLVKQIKLLKLSEQDELLVSPNSNLYNYL